MKYSPYSFSKLSTHKQCNRKFKYNYIDKAPQDKKDMTALLKGGAVHSILEHYPYQSTHKLAPQYQHIADKFIETKLGKLYLTQNSIKEYDFGLTNKLIPTTYSDKEALFRGSIDFICTIDKTLYLCDWKTGKYKEEKWQLYDQLMFYAIYFFQKYENINTINISYVYVEHENMENTMILERQYLDTYIQELVELILNVEHDEDFKKTISPLCNYCEFKTHCDNDSSL
jgi:CRISPR/Cas system-associated exonuclease Cas4 (RecB family)